MGWQELEPGLWIYEVGDLTLEVQIAFGAAFGAVLFDGELVADVELGPAARLYPLLVRDGTRPCGVTP